VTRLAPPERQRLVASLGAASGQSSPLRTFRDARAAHHLHLSGLR
jgi:hypothetical protein